MFDAAPDPQTLKLVIAALAAITGCGFLFLHYRRLRIARQALDWPLAPGVVTASRTAQRWGFGGGLWTAGLWYVPEVTYRYEVGGEKFTGRRVFLSDTGFSKRKTAREVIGRYPRAADVAVRYNPERPGQACLDPVYRDRRALAGALLLFAICGAALLS